MGSSSPHPIMQVVDLECQLGLGKMLSVVSCLLKTSESLALLQLGDHQGAIGEFQKVLDLDDEDINARLQKADAAQMLARLTKQQQPRSF